VVSERPNPLHGSRSRRRIRSPRCGHGAAPVTAAVRLGSNQRRRSHGGRSPAVDIIFGRYGTPAASSSHNRVVLEEKCGRAPVSNWVTALGVVAAPTLKPRSIGRSAYTRPRQCAPSADRRSFPRALLNFEGAAPISGPFVRIFLVCELDTLGWGPVVPYV